MSSGRFRTEADIEPYFLIAGLRVDLEALALEIAIDGGSIVGYL
jgi:hypothetical protein